MVRNANKGPVILAFFICTKFHMEANSFGSIMLKCRTTKISRIDNCIKLGEFTPTIFRVRVDHAKKVTKRTKKYKKKHDPDSAGCKWWVMNFPHIKPRPFSYMVSKCSKFYVHFNYVLCFFGKHLLHGKPGDATV